MTAGGDQHQRRQGKDNDGWIWVERRKNHGSNIQHGNSNIQFKKYHNNPGNIHPNFISTEKVSTSVYITNLPWNVTPKEVWEACKKWGIVIDVYISSKLSKAGARFGFIRFLQVKDIVTLVSNLRSLWMGNFHIYADIARNSRSSGPSKDYNQKKKQEPTSGTKSYAEILKEGKINNRKSDQFHNFNQSLSSKNDSMPVHKKLEVVIDDDDCMSLGAETSSFLAKVVDVQVISNLHSIFKLNGFFDSTIIYVGGRWIWVELDNANSLSSFKASVELSKYFAEFKAIDKNFRPEERVVWIEIVGAPFSAWTENAFKKIGRLWGDSICVDFGKGEMLSHGKVCIITKSMKKIQHEINVVFKGKSYDVFVTEMANWVPEFESCLDDGSQNSSEDTSCGSGNGDFSTDSSALNSTERLFKEVDTCGFVKKANDDFNNSFLGKSNSMENWIHSDLPVGNSSTKAVEEVFNDDCESRVKDYAESRISTPPGFKGETKQNVRRHGSGDRFASKADDVAESFGDLFRGKNDNSSVNGSFYRGNKVLESPSKRMIRLARLGNIFGLETPPDPAPLVEFRKIRRLWGNCQFDFATFSG